MQAARALLVAVTAELAARAQRRHDDLERRAIGTLGVRLNRNAATIIVDRDRAICTDHDQDLVTDTGHRLVDTVVDHLGDQLMQTAHISAADIHTGALAHML